MKRETTTALPSIGLIGLIVLLSGCAPVQALDTAELRAEAVREEVELIAEAVSTFDATEIEELQCAEPRLIEVPRQTELPSTATLPLTVEIGEVEPLDLAHSEYTDPDPGAEFLLTALRDSGAATGESPVQLPDVIVRVDDREACLWAMGPRFVVLLGL